MGSIGGIEKMMVFGILIIIVAILAIAFYSAIKVEDDMTPNRMRAQGEVPIEIIDPDPGGTQENNETVRTDKPLIHDIINNSLKKNEPTNRSGEPDPGITKTGTGEGGTENPGENMPEKPKKELTYKVQSGDSLRKIARVRLGDAERYVEIEKLNPGVEANRLQIGQVLKLPVGAPAAEPKRVEETSGDTAADPADMVTARPGSYTVKTGDTLIKLSRKFYGNSSGWLRIYEANRESIPNPNAIAVGTRLKIPE
jgi:nucleoid-associated protein YgaU